MGLFGALNKMAGYSEEKMMEVFHDILQSIDSKPLCPISVAFKKNVSALRQRVYASGYATITDTNALFVYTAMPIKGAAIYNYESPKKLQIKDTVAGQKVIEGKFLNMKTMEFDDLILQVSYKVDGFSNQKTNLEHFLFILEQHKTK